MARINTDQMKQLRGSNAKTWKLVIADYLAEHQGTEEIALYNATRPDRLNIPDRQKIKNLASEYTYLKDAGYMLQKEDNKVFLLAKPIPGNKEEFDVLPGMEQRVADALGIPVESIMPPPEPEKPEESKPAAKK